MDSDVILFGFVMTKSIQFRYASQLTLNKRKLASVVQHDWNSKKSFK